MNLFERLLGCCRGADTVGRRGERAAARFLKRQHYRILARNLRTRMGEVDLLGEAPDRRTVVVVEVKATEASTPADDAIPPEVHVNHAKQHKLTALAALLVRQYRLHDRPVRFDVIGVHLRPGAEPIVRHHVAAFEATF